MTLEEAKKLLMGLTLTIGELQKIVARLNAAIIERKAAKSHFDILEQRLYLLEDELNCVNKQRDDLQDTVQRCRRLERWKERTIYIREDHDVEEYHTHLSHPAGEWVKAAELQWALDLSGEGKSENPLVPPTLPPKKD